MICGQRCRIGMEVALETVRGSFRLKLRIGRGFESWRRPTGFDEVAESFEENVLRVATRWNEVRRHGFKRAIVPKGNAPKGKVAGMEVIPVSKLSEALAALE